MNKNKEYIYITRTMKLNIFIEDALKKQKNLIPKEIGTLYTRCKVKERGKNAYRL